MSSNIGEQTINLDPKTHIPLSYKRITHNDDIKPITPEMLENARTLRKNQTPTEDLLWSYLRNRQLNNFKFLRQHPFGGFILDFFCWKEKLAIELDGNIHNRPDIMERDEIRQNFLEENGIEVIRFKNNEVFSEVETVLEKILCMLNGRY